MRALQLLARNGVPVLETVMAASARDFFFSSRIRHTRYWRDWSSDVCSSDLMALMQRILPHVHQALDVAQRLKGADEPRRSLERTLDWLADGAVLVRGNGKLVYANEAFRAIAQRRDGVGITKGE